MNARSLLVALVAVAAAAAPLAAEAQPGPRGGAMGRHGGLVGGEPHGLGFFDRALPRMAERLDLTDEQLARIEAIVDDATPALESMAERLREGREAWREANDDPTVFDEGAFRSHAEAQQALRIELMVVVQKTKAAIFAELTPQQLEELEELREDAGQRPRRHSKFRRR